MHPGIIAAIAAVSVFALTVGISFPLLALILEGAGLSETFIGINSAMLPVGVLVSAPFIPWAARRFAVVWLSIGAGFATALLLFGFALIESPYVWFALRFGLGVAINVLFVLSETWINQLAPARTRGRIMGVYATAVSLGFTIGPVTVAAVGTEGGAAFGIAIGTTLAALVILIAARRHLPAFPDVGDGDIGAFSRAAPVLLALVGAIALFDQTTMSLLPIFGLRIGMDVEAATLAVGVLGAANVLLQLPIGWLADLMPRQALALALSLVVVVGAALMPSAAGSDLLWPLLFVWGGAGYGAYTVALAELGGRFNGAMLLAGNAAFAVMWGVGGIIGPAAGGAAMDGFGPVGLPLVLAVVFAGLALALARRPLVRRERGEEAYEEVDAL